MYCATPGYLLVSFRLERARSSMSARQSLWYQVAAHIAAATRNENLFGAVIHIPNARTLSIWITAQDS